MSSGNLPTANAPTKSSQYSVSAIPAFKGSASAATLNYASAAGAGPSSLLSNNHQNKAAPAAPAVTTANSNHARQQSVKVDASGGMTVPPSRVNQIRTAADCQLNHFIVPSFVRFGSRGLSRCCCCIGCLCDLPSSWRQAACPCGDGRLGSVMVDRATVYKRKSADPNVFSFHQPTSRLERLKTLLRSSPLRLPLPLP